MEPLVGQPGQGSHALVIGSSLAGLLAGRVLAEHFDRVTIVERDRLPDGPEPRKGVPQARHAHQMLVRGRQILEQLFPGLEAELIAAGAMAANWPTDMMWLGRAGWGARFQSDLATYACSRDLLECNVRRRVAANQRVRFLEGCDVVELLADQQRAVVTGARIRQRERPDEAAVELRADLVVDTSGRTSRAPEWLTALGYQPPQETTINAFLGYSTRYYTRPKGLETDWKFLIIQSRPPDSSRAGLLFPLEGGRWLAGVVGAAHDYPPTDEAGFLDFARSLPSPLIYDLIKDAEPLSPVYGYRRTENRLRHYERLARWPEQFVVLGDAACCFNPVYGQGMTVAAQGALVLDQSLRQGRAGRSEALPAGMARRFQRRLAKNNAIPWMMATGEDFRYPTTEGGRRGPLMRLMHNYIDRVMLVASWNPDVYLAFLEVMNLLKPPTSLFRPAILAQVLRQPSSARTHPAALNTPLVSED